MSRLYTPKSPLLRVLAAALMLVCASPLHAQTQAPAPPQEENPGALAREAIEKMMRALSLVIENLPQYAPPEFNENGDIIIRRLNPRVEKPRPRSPAPPDGTRT